MNKLFLSVALLVVAPAFVFAADAAKPVVDAAKPATDKAAEVKKEAKVEAPKAANADEAAKFAKDAIVATVNTAGAEFRAALAFKQEAQATLVKAQAEADKAVTADDKKDADKTAALVKAAADAKAAVEAGQKDLADFTKDKTGVVAFVKAQVDKLGLTMVAHPWIAAATVAAMTVAIVESVHFLVASEDEEAQF